MFCVACSPTPEAPPAPADLLPPPALVTLLADLQMAEARAQRAARAPDTIQAFYLQAEAEIYRRRQLSRAQFNRSYAYYAARPAELTTIYGALVDTLARREVQVKQQQAATAPADQPPAPATDHLPAQPPKEPLSKVQLRNKLDRKRQN